MKINKFVLQRVSFMPQELRSGILYVSEEFNTSAHLCACGCGSKIRTPLGPTDWSFVETDSGPSLYPSIGNWQIACKSHYWIRKGNVMWANEWTYDQIMAGRHEEENRRLSYYNALGNSKNKAHKNFWEWIKNLFSS